MQEALNNVRRHAQAQNAEVLLDGSDDWLRLSISDSGAGFDLSSVGQGQSLGLASMKERVQLIGGKLDIRSTPGQGTTIEASIPLQHVSIATHPVELTN